MVARHFLKRSCPICQQSEVTQEKIASARRAEDLDYDSLVPFWNGFFKEKIFFSYARCQICELLFCPTFFHPDQLEKLYEQMPPNMDLVPEAALRKTQAGYFETLRQHSDLAGNYIEVGPDTGIFTAQCSRFGAFDRYWLCEPNRAVREALIRSVDPHPHVIIDDMFGFTSIPNRCAGVAVMIQVLDHLLDPIATLAELKTKLLPGAKLLLVTHNEQSVLRKLIGWKWPAFCLQHPQIYSPQSMTRLLEKAGYTVDSIERTKNYFQASFLLKHLLWALGVKVQRVPRFFDFTIGLKLGNIITIATPKSHA